ncbi:hypothetical protein BC938DRAFT_474237 [Jimgerdemannia flammicorona]|uniref:F-box domain-containing protein n=1 Tax=Jimgerdemannia flammicorona TaxID=994334 RepID=A0A433QSP1_9FUNG|nr:hypothetical protein BC938DRAFT_474237 [Jimgerdemannia flammicorona]
MSTNEHTAKDISPPTLTTLPSELLMFELIPQLDSPLSLLNLSVTNRYLATLCLPEFRRRVLSRDLPAADQMRFKPPDDETAARLTDKEFKMLYVRYVRRVCCECWSRKGERHALWKGRAVCQKCQRRNDR